MSARGRGRPRIYPDWHDRAGTSWAFSEHPNWSVCREVLRRPDLPTLCDEWDGFDNFVTFVFGVTTEIGYQPRYHRLFPIHAAVPLGPGNVVWWPRRGPAIPEELQPLFRLARAEQQRHDWRCDCTRITVCDYHLAADRAGHNVPDGSPLLPENAAVVVELQRRYSSTTSRRHEPKAVPLLTRNVEPLETEYERRCNGLV